MELIEKTISSRTLYKGRILNLKVDEVTLPNGGTSVREVIAHGGAAAVSVPLRPVKEEASVWSRWFTLDILADTESFYLLSGKKRSHRD